MYLTVLKWLALLALATSLVLGPVYYYRKVVEEVRVAADAVGYDRRVSEENSARAVADQKAEKLQAEEATQAKIRAQEQRNVDLKVNRLEQALRDAAKKNPQITTPIVTADLARLWNASADGTFGSDEPPEEIPDRPVA